MPNFIVWYWWVAHHRWNTMGVFRWILCTKSSPSNLVLYYGMLNHMHHRKCTDHLGMPNWLTPTCSHGCFALQVSPKLPVNLIWSHRQCSDVQPQLINHVFVYWVNFSTALCVGLAKYGPKSAVHMHIIMWLGFPFSLYRSLPHNYIHVHSFFVHILQGQHKQL